MTINTTRPQETWLIIGASRGIGLEFVRQLLSKSNTFVFAAIRSCGLPMPLHELMNASESKDRLHILRGCDVASEERLRDMVDSITKMSSSQPVQHVVLNAGVLHYPSRASEATFTSFERHLRVNTVGPIYAAQRLLATPELGPHLKTMTFISSDSGSALDFRAHEDGFAAYSASKAALNQLLRHLAAELKRNGREYPIVLALHPGEVGDTDMGSGIIVNWEVKGIIGVKESVRGCLDVIGDKGRFIEESPSFWTWDGRRHPW